MVIAELLPHIEDVLFVGHSGVVVKLVEAGLKSIDHQSDIMKALLIAFHCENDTKCCVPSFLTLTAYEVYTEHKENMKSDKDLTRVSITLLVTVVDFYMYHCRSLYMCKGHCWCKHC